MKRILLTFVLLALGVCARADQLLYNVDGKRTIILKDDGSLLDTTTPGRSAWGHLEEGDLIYDRKGIHTIGYRKGNVLYTNTGHVLAYFRKTDKPRDQLLYNADTGNRTIILKGDGSLLYDADGKIFGHLDGDTIYDRKYIEVIGYRKGNVLYRDDSPYTHVIGYFNLVPPAQD